MDRSHILQLQDSFRRRLHGLLFLESTLWAASFWFFTGGTAILVFRSVWGVANPSMAWVVPGLLMALAFGAWQAGQRLPDDQTLMALLDRENRAGGLLMAAGEGPIGAWTGRLDRPVEPPVTWHSRRSLLVFAAASAYLVLGFALPQQMVKPSGPRHLDLQAESERLQEKIDALKNEDLLDATQAEKLEEKLSALMKEATSDDPAKTYEALDHLEEMLAKVTSQALEKTLDRNQKLAEAGALAEGLLEDPASSTFQSRLGALNENLDGLEGASGTASMPAGFNDPDMVTPLDESATPEQIQQLLDKLGKQQMNLDAKLIKLGKVGLIDKKTFEALKKKAGSGSCPNPDKGMIVFDEEGKEGSPGSEAILLDLPGGNQTGKGGISQGRGDAPLRFNGKTEEGGVGFKEEALPPARLPALDNSQSIGVGLSAPAVETRFEPVGAGGFAEGAHGTAAAHTQRILPQHQSTVKRYFQRQEGGR
ncbi:MAG: hypothetical protein GX442_08195 [Candidatus Riflebacteria bacterium]|nr:hypothetical protein [Candidatus Riflebacteria bacterium]